MIRFSLDSSDVGLGLGVALEDASFCCSTAISCSLSFKILARVLTVSSKEGGLVCSGLGGATLDAGVEAAGVAAGLAAGGAALYAAVLCVTVGEVVVVVAATSAISALLGTDPGAGLDTGSFLKASRTLRQSDSCVASSGQRALVRWTSTAIDGTDNDRLRIVGVVGVDTTVTSAIV